MTKRIQTASGIPARQRYNNLIRAYKAYESERLGIPARKVKVRGSSESAENFRKFYKLLTAKQNPNDFRKQYAKLGFGNAYWSVYDGVSPKLAIEKYGESDIVRARGD